jgi:hypothetical protein
MPNPLMAKIGPLPAWGWLGTGAGALLAIGAARKGSGSSSQGGGSAPPGSQQQAPANMTTDPNSLGLAAQGVYGHGFHPSGGSNGWTGQQSGQYQTTPVQHEIRPPRGHSGGWGGAHPGTGHHGIGGGHQGVGQGEHGGRVPHPGPRAGGRGAPRKIGGSRGVQKGRGKR